MTKYMFSDFFVTQLKNQKYELKNQNYVKIDFLVTQLKNQNYDKKGL